MRTVGPNEFKCAVCQGVFEKALTEEEAIVQLAEEFGPGWSPVDCDVVCDDCFKEASRWAITA